MFQIALFSNEFHRAGVVRLWGEVFGHATGHHTPGLSIDKKIAQADDLFFVAVDAGAVVGTVRAGYDGHRGWLYSVAVDPGSRQQGIGAALVVHAEKALAARGCMRSICRCWVGTRRWWVFMKRWGSWLSRVSVWASCLPPTSRRARSRVRIFLKKSGGC